MKNESKTFKQLSSQTIHHSPHFDVSGIHGVKHMRANTFGEVYWKEFYLETLDDPLHPKHYDFIQRLGLICRHLENLHVSINARTVFSHRDWFATMHLDEPYKALLSRCPTILLDGNRILIKFKRAACEFDGKRWRYSLMPATGTMAWSSEWSYGGLVRRGYRNAPLSEIDLNRVLLCLQHYRVPTNLLAIMAEQLTPRRFH